MTADARALALCCTAVSLVLLHASDARATRDRPPPGHTGGFNEPTCTECHFGGDANDGPGSLALTGVPAVFEPGRTYDITVSITQPSMRAAGFQMTARFEQDGRQAGTLAVRDSERRRIAVTSLSGIDYAHHLADGTALVGPDSACWSVTWTAPRESGVVMFHAAANAADDDMSPLGDYIYTAALRSSAH